MPVIWTAATTAPVDLSLNTNHRSGFRRYLAACPGCARTVWWNCGPERLPTPDCFCTPEEGTT